MASPSGAVTSCLIFLVQIVTSSHYHRHGGLFPEPVNLGPRAEIVANGTCGERGPETFCRLSRGGGRGGRETTCGVCDAKSADKRHPPEAAIDANPDTWWQSSTLANGDNFQHVTLTIDLKQVYQILHVRVRAGPSPRPGNWILEKSIDGIEYLPWQYFAVSGDECLARYGARPTHPAHILRIPGRPPCVTAFSKVTPFEGGEINVGLTQGWPNGSLASPEMAFHTSARFIRIKIQKLSSHKFEKTRHSHGSDLVNRFYYTIKDILIQGRCNCSGHAHRCPYDLMLGKSVCECAHKTTGEHCEECLPLYNQRQWKPGTPKEANACLKCECYGHARSCIYDPTIESSISYDGSGRGGGVCIGCEAHTSGVNCESCEDGWYRPAGVPLNASKPCVPCECNLRGSTGFCWKDDSEIHLNKLPGICECLEGFTGRKCDRCAPGYRGFPDCTKCDCDLEGLLPGSLCDSQCVCKPNFDGKRCDRCKPGYFLMAEPQGSVECRECYCSGLKVECERASGYSVTEFMTMEGWQVSDLLTSYIVQPYNRFPKSHQISIADTQMSGLVYYYWMAPPPYTGNKLTSYGSTITFSVSWDYRRGDTSGKETSGPDLVLIGHNGLRIGYGSMQHKEANLNITIPLVEDGWYHVLDDVGDMVTRLKRNQGNWVEYRGDDISRGQLLSVLANIKHMLVRAKYHTDQAEGSLYACSIELGSEGGSGTAVGFIEKCFCPVGNAGLSCERCDYGFTRIMDGVSPMHKVVCSKCNCHGHSPTCDPISGQCAMCEHNTTGSVCDKCAEGYYGDATNGSPNDCRQCACPFIESSNNFSPTCVADHLGYVCTACPEGYTGRHCEQCAPGYFGSPEEIGSTCKPCNCNDGPCDHLTGRCLSCLGNTQGWKCDKCKPNHYGNASTTGCFPCGCSPIGSEFSEGCNLEDGQCHCKERFTGRTCDRCETGFGNISAGCVACNCDSIGAKSSLCDSVTGACECQPGVTGLSCHTCLPEHYGYSESGCKRCNCDPLGSESSECDIITGECKCKPRVEGRTCNECHLGFWGLGPSGCTPCNCDTLGSKNSSCDQTTGQCYCKPGVGNQKCDHCSPLYYNMSSEGCTECDLCELPGRICDPDTGACVCPPLTAGDFCQGCEINAWGYNPQKGCKPCDCDPFGSLGERCDALAGRCTCKEGYTGPKCQSCAKGYFGHPSCKKCECNIAGTQSHHCHDGVCECDGTGQCPCKDLVTGQRCNKCKDGTFGLLAENSKGCTECFCFNRSTVCTDAHLEWTEIRMGRPRIIMINYDNETVPDNVIYPVDTQEICYINLAMPGNNGMVKKEEKFLNITNNLRIIPGQLGNVELGVSYWFDSPVYWQLSNDFLGDKVLSYGGYLRFTVETNGGSTQFPESVLSSYPLIQIQGNDRIVLEHFPYKGKHHSGRHNVRLHETQWRMKNNPRDYVSRQTMMLALQNLQHILIRASDSMDFVEARLREVTLDTAIAFPTTRAPSTTGIELCECPKNYNATSCQNPSLGFYRWRSGEVTSTIIIDLIGEAKPCECNNRSSTCDMETGKCLDCADNTGGHWCESCAEGYYGDPGQGVACKACPCPSEARNFATSCQVFEDGNRSCFCKEGYTGQYCDRCSYGYYGHPANGGTCKRCTCHPFGRISEGCDENTGQCTCREGVTGWDCSTCVDKLNVLSEDGCTECTDDCIIMLLDEVYGIEERLENQTSNILSGMFVPSLEPLMKINFKSSELESKLRQSQKNLIWADDVQIMIDRDFRAKERQLIQKLKKLSKIKNPGELVDLVSVEKNIVDMLHTNVKETTGVISDVSGRLKTYAEGDSEKISIDAMLLEARMILGRIRDTDLETRKVESDRLLRMCKNYLNDLSYLGDRREIEYLHQRVDDLARRLKDLNSIAYDTEDIYYEIQGLISSNQNFTKILRQQNHDVIRMSEDIREMTNETFYKNEITKVNQLEAEDSAMAMISLFDSVNIGARALDERTKNIYNVKDDLTNSVIAALAHADKLADEVEIYQNWFKSDNTLAKRASSAYVDIINALNEAKYAVDNATLAADIAHEKAYPGIGTPSLVDKAIESKLLSQELLLRSQELQRSVNFLGPKLSDTTVALDRASRNTENMKFEMQNIKKQVDELNQDLLTVKDSSIDTTAECNEVIKYTENVEDEVFSLRFNITHKLRPALDALEADGEVSLNTARELIDEAHANTKQTQDVIDQMAFTSKKQSHQFEKWNNTIASKLEALRNKITRAHHNANRIRLSMTSIGDSGGTCVRTYKPAHLEPSTMTTIVLTYAISSQLRDALLFYLPSGSTDDFVAVEMINRKIRFVWNVGGGLGEVTHPMHIQTAGDLNKDQHWYRVQAERVSNIGYLWVRPVVVPEGSLLKDSPPVTNASSPGVGRFDVGQGDRVWVGGADRRHPHLLSTQSGLVGCLHHLFLNGRPIGLWDFDTQNPHSCTACVEGAQEVVDESSYSFAGDGYAVVTHDNSGVFNKYLFSVSLKFKTFDHNALLFMGSENGTGRFVSLTLKNGRVVFKIGYGGDSSLEMSTIEKYNNGKWTRIEASRYFDRKKKLEKGVLKVSNEVRDGAPSVPPNQDSIPDMSMAKYYVGGVPPGEKDLPPNIRAFLGCMSDVQIDQGAYSLLKGKYWGMQPSCSSKPITVAGFFGNGFIELPSHSLKKKDNFGFVFSSAQRDALLMLSTFEGGNALLDDKEEMTNLIEFEDKLSYYSVSLRRGQIDVRLNAGKGEVRLASVSSEYGDSKYHTINVAKVGKRLELRVDDVLDAVTMLPEGSATFKANGESGGLFFGGLPTGFNTTGRTFSNIPFVGTIKDIIFSDKVYGFDEPLRFEDVTIGRFGPTTTQPRLNEPSNSISTGCRKVLSYSIDPRAVSFGDEPFSHVQISFRKRAVLQKNFSLELDFRTFYQNGLIFMIPGVRNKQPHYLMAALRNGRVQIVLKGRRKIETTAQAVFNDGMWHNLVLEKEDRRMTLRIDSIDPEKTKTPKKMNVGNVMYIGGLPETGVQLPNNLINKLEGFKGCVRALKVNGREEPLMVEKTVPYPKVGQCFPQVERGSYFPGDAFAIYKKKFNVGSLLELELEFRTSEMNGILLSVAEPQGYPALSLELNNGKVIMSGDMGDRRPFRVVQEFESEFAVCDNRWHRVQAHYVNDELSLRVDDRDQSYWLSDNGHLTATTTNSPLYIGGIPDYASIGTLGTREYFKGCIRNVIISGERRDWTAMAALHNVLHTSCPLPPS
ncbi:laminin subunit [Nesidiocoris tenuis]|uniref:Laminin subunit n=1 Tax=Nesidiocoris tenuis TaxID=355587 RepID=A0ABN7A9D0_9HEMI|nr:laminin subunit [Nesidiocoris tenuis]